MSRKRISVPMQDVIFETPGNPIPADAHAGMLTMPDRRRIRYARFAAQGRPLKGTVIIIPGRNECIEKYFETIGDLSNRGFGSVIFDLRGQGGSERLVSDPQRGYIDDFSQYVADIEPLFQQVILPDCRGPYFILAHSTGALVALLATPLLTNRVQRMVLVAPLLAPTGLPISAANACRLASLMHALGLGTVYLSGGPRWREPPPFATNVLTTDPDRYARNVDIYRHHPELSIGGATASWVRAACEASRRVQHPDFVARLNIPSLIVAASADQVVDSHAIEHFATRLRAGSLVMIDGARHEILQEADIYREQLLAAFDAFVPGSG